jgi:hypothetical protein
MTADGAAFIGKLQAALMPDVLECFSDWPEYKLDAFANQICTFRTWLEENRVCSYIRRDITIDISGFLPISV